MSILIFSPNGKTVNKSSLVTAVGAADTVGKTIILTSPVTLSANLTIPSTIALRIEKGGMISINSGYILTIKGSLEAGKYHIFNGRVAHDGEVIPQWFGAMGDGLGLTPADTGEDVESASWNTWEGTPFKDGATVAGVHSYDWSPFYGTGSFVPPTTKPFLNTDTWDYIGLNSALWVKRTGEGFPITHIPSGDYKISFAATTLRSFGGLLIMRNQEQFIRGDGHFQTNISPKETGAWFGTHNYQIEDAYKLITLWRTGGPETLVQGLHLSGPSDYSYISQNIVLIYGSNLNGVNYRDLWLTSCGNGLVFTDYTTCGVNTITAEYFYGSCIKSSSTSFFSIKNSTIWDIAAVGGVKGISADGAVDVIACVFAGCQAGQIIAGSRSNIQNCDLNYSSEYGAHGLGQVKVSSYSKVIGNKITASVLADQVEQLSIGNFSIVSNNLFDSAANQPCIRVGDYTNGSANNININGNIFKKAGSGATNSNSAIVAPTGESWFAAGTLSVLVEGNIFDGGYNNRSVNTLYWATNIETGYALAPTIPQGITSAIASKADILNTTGKYEGKMVWNSTTHRYVFAAGSADTDIWYDAVGATAHSPI